MKVVYLASDPRDTHKGGRSEVEKRRYTIIKSSLWATAAQAPREALGKVQTCPGNHPAWGRDIYTSIAERLVEGCSWGYNNNSPALQASHTQEDKVNFYSSRKFLQAPWGRCWKVGVSQSRRLKVAKSEGEGSVYYHTLQGKYSQEAWTASVSIATSGGPHAHPHRKVTGNLAHSRASDFIVGKPRS